MKKAATTILLLALIFISSSHIKEIQQESIKVFHVIDGDTFVGTNKGEEVIIRLYGIDAPEINQSYGNKAKDWLQSKIEGKSINMKKIGKGYYNRTIAIVSTNGQNINEALVRNGLAWVSSWYCKQETLCNRWRDYQQQAQENNIGLWDQHNPIPPWEFRGNN